MTLESKAKTSAEIHDAMRSPFQNDIVKGWDDNQKWVPLEEAQKLEALNEGLEKIAFENSLKVDRANKILDGAKHEWGAEGERMFERLREVLK